MHAGIVKLPSVNIFPLIKRIIYLKLREDLFNVSNFYFLSEPTLWIDEC